MENLIKKFFDDGFNLGDEENSIDDFDGGYGAGDSAGHGSEDGSGDGSGKSFGAGFGLDNGSGDSSGFGSNLGNGHGDDYGSGDGSGFSFGNGIKTYIGKTIYQIDWTPTIIESVRGNVAKGFIVKDDLTLEPCFVVKQDNFFAHGETLHKAQEALQDKLSSKYDEDTRIEMFKKEFPDNNKKYPAKSFFVWHNKLTGSCEMGRKNFCRLKGINIETDTFTVAEFLKITERVYGSSILKKLI